MKRSIYYSGAALVVAAVFVAGLALADNKTAPAVDPQMAEMMKKAEEAAAPSAAHKKLEPFVGEWNAEVKMWMSPDAPPEVSKGTAKSTWILNGRYVQEDFSGEMMGKPFKGMSLTGYDNVRQKYRGVWVDDMSTTIVTSEGDIDPAGKVFTFGGNYADRAGLHIQQELAPNYILPAVREPGDDKNAPLIQRSFVTPYGRRPRP